MPKSREIDGRDHQDVLNLGDNKTKTIMFNIFIKKNKFTEQLLGQSRSIKHSAYSQEVSVCLGEIRQTHGLLKKKVSINKTLKAFKLPLP